MNNQQDNKKIEKIPVRQPDGTFSMIQVSSVQSDIPRKTNEEEVIKNQDKEVVTDLPKEKIPPKVLKEKPIVTPKVSLVKKDDSQKQKVIDQQVIKKDSQR